MSKILNNNTKLELIAMRLRFDVLCVPGSNLLGSFQKLLDTPITHMMYCISRSILNKEIRTRDIKLFECYFLHRRTNKHTCYVLTKTGRDNNNILAGIKTYNTN